MAKSKKSSKRYKKGAITAAAIAAAIMAAAAAQHYGSKGRNGPQPIAPDQPPVHPPKYHVKPIKPPGATDHGPITKPPPQNKYPVKPSSKHIMRK